MAAMKSSVISMTARFDLRPNGREAHFTTTIAGPCRKHLGGSGGDTTSRTVSGCAVIQAPSTFWSKACVVLSILNGDQRSSLRGPTAIGGSDRLVAACEAGRHHYVELKLAGRSQARKGHGRVHRSEEHTSELQSPCNLVCRL